MYVSFSAQQPNYSHGSGVFDTAASQQHGTGVKPKVEADAFGDLLGGFQPTKKEDGPTTLSAMRKDELSKTMDPNKLKVKRKISIISTRFYRINRFLFRKYRIKQFLFRK